MGLRISDGRLVNLSGGVGICLIRFSIRWIDRKKRKEKEG